MPTLSPDEKRALAAIADGADVWSPALARTLRDIQAKYPHLLDIGDARARNYSGVEAMPYFGAILTAAGCEAIGISVNIHCAECGGEIPDEDQLFTGRDEFNRVICPGCVVTASSVPSVVKNPVAGGAQ